MNKKLRIWLLSGNKIKSAESFSKQPTQLMVELNSSLLHIIVTMVHLYTYWQKRKYWKKNMHVDHQTFDFYSIKRTVLLNVLLPSIFQKISIKHTVPPNFLRQQFIIPSLLNDLI